MINWFAGLEFGVDVFLFFLFFCFSLVGIIGWGFKWRTGEVF